MKRPMLFAVFIQILSCATMDLHFRENALKNRPGAILIGHLESRTVTYRPYAAANLRDSLRFEFFSRGFRSELAENDGPAPRENAPSGAMESPDPDTTRKKRQAVGVPSREAVAALCTRHSADIFIGGSFSESGTGDYADTETSTLVTLLVYERTGEKIGEVRYLLNDTMADASVAKTVAEKLAGAIIARFP
ncbi:MAG TPA: hypothetical protein VLM75_09830 [Spirochaetota bacterium]|nr:hypothetical protein [Spirochaetota bacterium]